MCRISKSNHTIVQAVLTQNRIERGWNPDSPKKRVSGRTEPYSYRCVESVKDEDDTNPFCYVADPTFFARSGMAIKEPEQLSGFPWKTLVVKNLDSFSQCESKITVRYDAFVKSLEPDWAKLWLAQNSALEEKFNELATQWYEETGMLSMVHKKAMHPAYQRIIGMGKEALPLIFRELNQKRGHWLWALCAITGEDAAKPTDNIKQAINSWLQWGRENGYL